MQTLKTNKKELKYYLKELIFENRCRVDRYDAGQHQLLLLVGLR